MDPRPFSLRQLAWMAQEKRRVSGELAAFTAAVVVAHIPMTGKALDPRAINPYRTVSESPALARVKARMAQIEWRVLTGR